MSKNFLLILIIHAVACTPTFGFSVQPQVDGNLANTLLQSAAAIEFNPNLSVQCFTVYMPQLTTLAKQYKDQYDNCIRTAQNATDYVNKQVRQNVVTISQWRESICKAYSNCTLDDNAPYKFLECNNKAATSAVTTSNNIQILAKDRMQFLNIRYEMISYDQNDCTEKCSQSYTDASKTIYAHLQACLNGKASQDPVTTTESE